MNLRWYIIRLYLKKERYKMRLFGSKTKPKKISVDRLSYGTIINSSPLHPSWYDIHVHGIRLYQLLRYHKNYKDTHTVTYVGDGGNRFTEPHIFEITVPCPTYTPLSEYFESGYRYTAYEYADAPIGAMGGVIEILMKTFDEMNGFYDGGQLIDIFKQLIEGIPEDEWKPWLDFSRKWSVCSVGAIIGQRKVWELLLQMFEKCRKPGGKVHSQRFCPAGFPNAPEYNLIGEL